MDGNTNTAAVGSVCVHCSLSRFASLSGIPGGGVSCFSKGATLTHLLWGTYSRNHFAKIALYCSCTSSVLCSGTGLALDITTGAHSPVRPLLCSHSHMFSASIYGV